MFEFKKDKPIYLQIVDDIVSDILNGNIKPNSKLMSIRDLASKYSVNPNTIQSATSHLITLEVIKSERGIGNIICDNTRLAKLKDEVSKKETKSFIANMKQKGLTLEDLQNLMKEMWDNEVT